jgi:hypothetical protein
MKTLTTLLIATLFLATSCRKDKVSKQEASAIEGKWQLVLITGGFAGLHMTAAEWGHTQSYEFRSPNKCTYIYDGSVVKTKYSLSTGISYSTGKDGTFVSVRSNGMYEYSFVGDTLILAMNVAADGTSEWYVKQ